MTDNDEADFKFTRRHEDHDWFRLLGAIANGKMLKGGKLRKHQIIDIGDGNTHKVTQPGYLYCYANDAWGFYENNKGSVSLTVTCVE